MHPYVFSILGRLTASALLLQTGAPVALSLKEGFDTSAARKAVVAKAVLPPPPMPGVPLMKATPAADPPDYAKRPHQIRVSSGFTLIDEQGRLRRDVPAKEEKAWRIELNEGPTPGRRARLLIQLAEVDISRHEPARAQARLETAVRLLPYASPDRGLAKFDTAITIFRQGRFTEAKEAFRNLVKSKLTGVDRRIAVLYSSHAAACEGYHQAHNNLGIPEPRELDPLCGISALAVCLRGRNMPYPKAELKKKIYYNGEGSSMADLEKALPSLGLSGHIVTADENGLKRLPKPLVAFVEHDHFIAVVKADKKGVGYFCSDCGTWPGGMVELSWKQWRAMEASIFLAVAKKGTPEALALDNLPTDKQNGPGHVLLASTRSETPNVVAAAESILSTLGTAVLGQANTLPKSPPPICGVSAVCLHCLGWQDVPFLEGAFGSIFGTNDPVNVATGEEEYTAPEGLSVYNPTGPSVYFAPSYSSLANTIPNGFGSGWTHPYNTRIIMASNTSTNGTLVLPNSGRIAFNFSSYLSSYNLPYPCGGSNLLGLSISLAANYGNPIHTVNSFTITYPDRSTWTFTPQYPSSGAGSGVAYYPTKITDKAGNYITLQWGTFTYREIDIDRSSGGSYPTDSLGLTTIKDSSGNVLLTLNYSGSTFANATDCYFRKIAYSVGSFATTNVPSGLPQSCDELTAVSQVVDTSVTTPPTRFAYGYQNYNNTELVGGANETVPFLHTISVPSPTGTGMSTATINYSSIGEVTDLVDANGNRTVLSPASVGGVAQPNSARVQILGPSPSTTVVKQYDLYFDAQMNPTKRVDAAGHTVWTKSYSDSNDPYGATSVTNGNGLTWTKTFDQFGRVKTSTTPKSITTTLNRTSSAFSAEISSVVQGSSSRGVNYSITNGFLNQATGPSPDGYTTDAYYAYTAKGNISSVTRPGNNYDSSGNVINQTTTYNYTTDGTYTQLERLGQPIKITDPLGHVTHIRYNPRGTISYVEDPSGYRTYYYYTTSDKVYSVYNPPTGNTGSGSSSVTNSYLYEGGPVYQVDARNESGSVVRTVSLTYGAEGESLARTGSAEAASQTYDPAYHTKTVSDGNSHVTTYTYDTVGHLTSVAYPGATGANYDQVKFTSYDFAGNLLSRTDGNGQVTNYTYTDGDGLLDSISYPGATGNNIALAYDNYDRLTSNGNGTEIVTKTYNNADAVISTTQQFVGSAIATQTTNYTYWPNGLRKTMANIAGNWAYAYDDEGRYTSMTSPAATAYAAYQNNDWESGRAAGVGTGIGTDYAQNPLGQTNVVWNWNSGGSNMVSRYYGATFDGAFNLAGLSAQVPTVSAQTGTIGYGYDTKDRLTGEVSPATGGSTQTHAYDTAGNATTIRGASGYTYNSDNQRTASGLAYDGNGSPTSYGPAMTFDPAKRLTSFGSSFSYGYRPDNLRAWKQVGSSRTYFLYDGSQPVAELNSSGTVTATNVFAPDGLVARKQAGSWIYYQFDLQGNVAQRLDGSGNILSSSTYDAYGKEFTTATLYDPFSYNGSSGYYHDLESDLYYCQNRYYDLYAGRWLTRDPISLTGGLNLYSYCAGQPVGNVDPLGLEGRGPVEPKLYVLYVLIEESSGALLKWGMTGRENPLRRYAQWYYQQHNARMHEVFRSTEKSEILEQERLMVKSCPGPLNRELWRGPVNFPGVGASGGSPLSDGSWEFRDPQEEATQAIDSWVKEKQKRREKGLHWWLEDE